MFDRFRFPSGENQESVCEKGNLSASTVIASVLGGKSRGHKRSSLTDPHHINFRRSNSSSFERQIQKRNVEPDRKWQERWHSICENCFEEGRECTHYREHRLRLLIVGHNPSDHAWSSGYSYSNPSNRMWSLLTGRLHPFRWDGILCPDTEISAQNTLPYTFGIGFTSLGTQPGNNAARYNRSTKWKERFFDRLREHMKRVRQCAHQKVDALDNCNCQEPYHPVVIAFSGKRQFSMLFNPPLSKIQHFGKQDHLPSDWPLRILSSWEVWVLPSSSGRAVMTNQERMAPYKSLAERIHQIHWPLVNAESTDSKHIQIKVSKC